MRILIKNGQVINPATDTNGVFDVLIENDTIIAVREQINEPADTVVDATGMWVVPGLIDLHVHLREPGFEYKETIETGTKSAAKGGVTTVCCMPNTKPVIDNEILVDWIYYKTSKVGSVNVIPVGAITKNQDGEELSNIGNMSKSGACAISEDGKTVMNASLMKKAMSYAKMFDMPIFSHCEEMTLGHGDMNAGENATIAGLRGIPNESEDLIVMRDIMLAEATGSRLHICHMSTAGSVALVKEAKAKGIQVTAEVAPHHFTLTDAACRTYDGNTKMNPPLRSQKDVDALLEGLRTGVIDTISTDHAPHHEDEKNCEFQKALNGIVGLETSLSLGITELVNKGVLTPMQLIEKMSYNAAKIIKIDKGNLAVGKIADIAIINPTEVYILDKTKLASKSKNTPFHGMQMTGRNKMTLVNGKIVYNGLNEGESND